jgi:hypothetical protein
MARRKPKAQPRRKHPLKADKSIGTDQLGNQWCTRCKHMGKPGDLRHSGEDDFPPDPMPPTPQAAKEREARMLGENA